MLDVALTSIEEMRTTISQVVAYSIPRDVGVSSPQTPIAPTFSRELHNLGDQSPPYLGFSLPQKQQLYGMPTAMMESMHPSTSVYSENMMETPSSFNQYLASTSTLGNFGQLGQPPGCMGYFPPQGALSLTNNSLQVMRQLMNESNHDMTHTITQQIINVFSPLIEHTNMSYQQLSHQMGMVVVFWCAASATDSSAKYSSGA